MSCKEVRELRIDLSKVDPQILTEALESLGYRVTPSIQNDGLFFTRASKAGRSAVTGRATGERFRLLCLDVPQAEAEIKQALEKRAPRRSENQSDK